MEQAMKKSLRHYGYTLTGVIIFLVIVMILWEGVMSQMGSYLRTEKKFRTQHTQRNGVTHSLAWAITLLETGLPPEDDYSCLMISPTDSNDIFVATFSQTAGIHYNIDIRLATNLDMWLPYAPETFNSTDDDKKDKKDKEDKDSKKDSKDKKPKK